MCAAMLFKNDDKCVPCKGFRLPESIEPGEIVTDQSLKKWRIGNRIGNGAFGVIYLASDDLQNSSNEKANACIKIEPHSNGPLYSEMHCYMRVAKPLDIDNYKTEKKYVHFGMPKFYGSGSHVYNNTKYRFLVIERFGRDFQKILEQYGNKVPHKLAYQVGIQILNVLEYLHGKQYIHGDIKAANILTGNKKGTINQFYLVDFGLAAKYTVYGRHKKYQYDGRYANFGTIEFASRDAHIGVFSRRGDLEILAYNMTKWMCSFLPWEDKLDDNDYISKQKIKSINDIPLFMKKCFGEEDVQALQDFFVYVKNLTSDEKPDYDKCRDILLKGSIRDGYTDDNTIIDLEHAFKHSLKISKSCFNLHTTIIDETKKDNCNEKEMEIDQTKNENDCEKENVEKEMEIDQKKNEKDCEKEMEIDQKNNEKDCEKEMEIEQENNDKDYENDMEMEIEDSTAPEHRSKSNLDEKESPQEKNEEKVTPLPRRTRNNPTEPEPSREKKAKKTAPVPRGTRNNPIEPEPILKEKKKKVAPEPRRTRNNPIELEPSQENKKSAAQRKTRNKSTESDSPKEKQAASAPRRTRNSPTELESPKEKQAVPASRRTRNISTESDSPKEKQVALAPRKTRNSPAEPESPKDKQAAPTPRKTKNSPTEPETPTEKQQAQVPRRTRNNPDEPDSSKENKATPVNRRTRNNPIESESPKKEKDNKKVSVVKGTKNKPTEPESPKEEKAAEPESPKEEKVALVPRRTRNNPIEPDQPQEKKGNKTGTPRKTRHSPTEPESPKEEKVAPPKEEKATPVPRRTRNNPIEPDQPQEKKGNKTGTPRKTRNSPTEPESPKEEKGNKKGSVVRGTIKKSTELETPKGKQTALTTRRARNNPSESESPEEKKADPTPRRTRNNPTEPESPKEKKTVLAPRGTRNNPTKSESSKEKNKNKQVSTPRGTRNISPEPESPNEKKEKEEATVPRGTRNDPNEALSSKEKKKSLAPRRIRDSPTEPDSPKESKENITDSLPKGSRSNTPEPESTKDKKENIKDSVSRGIKKDLTESESTKEKKNSLALSGTKNNSAAQKPTQEEKSKESTPAPRRTRKNPIEPEPIQEKIVSESSDDDLEEIMIKTEKLKLEERKKLYPKEYIFIRKDNFDNPTPQMVQLMEQLRKKAEMPHVCTKRHKHKKACNVKNVTYDETPYYYTPEMEAVIRQRDMKMLSQPMVYEPLPEIPQPVIIPKDDSKISQMDTQDKINESIDDLDQDLLDCFDANVNAFVNANMSSILNESSIMNLDDSSESNMDIDMDTNLLESKDVDSQEMSNMLEQSGISVEQNNDIIEIGDKLYGDKDNVALSSSEKIRSVENIVDKTEVDPDSSAQEEADLSNTHQDSDSVVTHQLDSNTMIGLTSEIEVQCVEKIDIDEVQCIQENNKEQFKYNETNNDEVQIIGESNIDKAQSVVESNIDKAQCVVETKIDEVKCIEIIFDDGKRVGNDIEEVQYVEESDIDKVQCVVESNIDEVKCIESNIDEGKCDNENKNEERNIDQGQYIEESKMKEVQNIEESNINKAQNIEKRKVDQFIDKAQCVVETKIDEVKCIEIIFDDGKRVGNDIEDVQYVEESDIDKDQCVVESNIGEVKCIESNIDEGKCVKENKNEESNIDQGQYIEESKMNEVQNIEESNINKAQNIEKRKVDQFIEKSNIDSQCMEVSNINESKGAEESNNDEVQEIEKINVDESQCIEESNVNEVKCIESNVDEVQCVEDNIGEIQCIEEQNIEEVQCIDEVQFIEERIDNKVKCDDIDIEEVQYIEESNVDKAQSEVESNIDNVQSAVESKCDEIDVDEVLHVEKSNIDKVQSVVESNIDTVHSGIESKLGEIKIDEVQHAEESNNDTAQCVMDSSNDIDQCVVESDIDEVQHAEESNNDTVQCVMDSNIENVQSVVESKCEEINIDEVQHVEESNIDTAQCVMDSNIDNVQSGIESKLGEIKIDEVQHAQESNNDTAQCVMDSNNDIDQCVVESDIDEVQHVEESNIDTAQCVMESNIDNIQSVVESKSDEINIDEVQHIEKSNIDTAKCVMESNIDNFKDILESAIYEGKHIQSNIDVVQSIKEIDNEVQCIEESKSVEAQYIEEGNINLVQCIEERSIDEVESVEESHSGAIISVNKDTEDYPIYPQEQSCMSNLNVNSDVLDIQQLHIEDETADSTVDYSRVYNMDHEDSENQVVSQSNEQLSISTISTNSELEVKQDICEQDVKQISDVENMITYDENVDIKSSDNRSCIEESNSLAIDQNTLLKATQQLSLSTEGNTGVTKEESDSLKCNTLALCPEVGNIFSDKSELDTENVHKSPVSASLLDSNQELNVNILSETIPDTCTKLAMELTLPEEVAPGSESPSSFKQKDLGSHDLSISEISCNLNQQESVSLHSSLMQSTVIPQTISFNNKVFTDEICDAGIEENNPNSLTPSECKDSFISETYCEDDKHEEILQKSKDSSCSETYCEDDDRHEETLSEYDDNDPNITSVSVSNQEILFHDNLVALTPENIIHRDLTYEKINISSSSPIRISPKAGQSSVLMGDASDIQEQNISDVSKDNSMHEKINISYSSPIRLSPKAGPSSLLKGDASDIQERNISDVSKDDSMQVNQDIVNITSDVEDIYVNKIPSVSDHVCSSDNGDDIRIISNEGKTFSDNIEMQVKDVIPDVCKPLLDQNDESDFNLSNIQAEFTSSNVENVEESKETSQSMANLEDKCTWYPKPSTIDSSLERENSQSIASLEEKCTWYPKPHTLDSSIEKEDGQHVAKLEEKSTWYPKPSIIDSSMEKEISQSTVNLEEKCTWYPKSSTIDSSMETNSESVVVDVHSHETQSSNTGSLPGKTTEVFESDVKKNKEDIKKDNKRITPQREGISTDTDSDVLVIDDTKECLKTENKIVQMDSFNKGSHKKVSHLKDHLQNLSLSDNQIKKSDHSGIISASKDDSEDKMVKKSKRRRLQKKRSQSSLDDSDFSCTYPDSFSSQDDLAASDSDGSASNRPTIRPIVIQMDKELGSPVIRPPIESLIIKKGQRSVSPVRLKRSNSRIGHWELICMKKTQAALNLQGRFVDYNVLPSTMRITRSISSQSEDENSFQTPQLNERQRQKRVSLCELSTMKKTASSLKSHNIKADILPPVMRTHRGISSQSTESDESTSQQVSEYENPYCTSQFKKEHYKQDRVGVCELSAIKESAASLSIHSIESDVLPPELRITRSITRPLEPEKKRKRKRQYQSLAEYIQDNYQDKSSITDVHMKQIAGTSSESNQYRLPDVKQIKQISRLNIDHVQQTPKIKKSTMKRYKRKRKLDFDDETDSEYNPYKTKKFKLEKQPRNIIRKEKRRITGDSISNVVQKEFENQDFDDETDSEYNPYKTKKIIHGKQPRNKNKNEKRRITGDSISNVVQKEIDNQDFITHRMKYYDKYLSQSTNLNQNSPFNFSQNSPLNLSINEHFTNSHCQPVNIYSDHPTGVLSSDVSEDTELNIQSDVLPPEMRITRSIR